MRLGCLLTLAVPLWMQATVSAGSADQLVLRVEEVVHSAKLAGGRLEGPRHQVLLGARTLRGKAHGLPVQLSWRGRRLLGQVDGWQVRLEVRDVQDGIVLDGLFAGKRADLLLRPTELSGRIGGCGYSLALAGDRYSGWRACEGQTVPQRVELTLPASMEELEEPARAAVIAVALLDFLGR